MGQVGLTTELTESSSREIGASFGLVGGTQKTPESEGPLGCSLGVGLRVLGIGFWGVLEEGKRLRGSAICDINTVNCLHFTVHRPLQLSSFRTLKGEAICSILR